MITLVKFEGSINAQGKLYLPIEIRNALGEQVELLGNAIALVVYPQGTPPHDVLRSLGVIILDLQNRQALSEESSASEKKAKINAAGRSK